MCGLLLHGPAGFDEWVCPEDPGEVQSHQGILQGLGSVLRPYYPEVTLRICRSGSKDWERTLESVGLISITV